MRGGIKLATVFFAPLPGFFLMMASGEKGEWRQWGGNSENNNVATEEGVLLEWGRFKKIRGTDDFEKAEGLKWWAGVNSHGYRGLHAAPPVVTQGMVLAGSNNEDGYVPHVADLDAGTLLCFREEDGEFLWQHTSERLEVGKVSDWEYMAVSASPCVEGDTLWWVTNRCEVVCLDLHGFRDGENDGPVQDERWTTEMDSDVIWSLDLREEFGVFPHNFTSSSPTILGETVFVSTGNGVDWRHGEVPFPDAPSLVALDKRTGKLLWEGHGPGANTLDGSWTSPAVGRFEDGPQVIFAGGDGWVYGFDPAGDGDGGGKVLWKFDVNPKTSKAWQKENERSNIVVNPVVSGGRVFVVLGDDPEHGFGQGRLVCIDPGKRGDVSPTLVFNRADPTEVIPHKRLLACDAEAGDFERPNLNSAEVWHYAEIDRCCGSPVISNGLLFIADLAGVLHCLDVESGLPHWRASMDANVTATPLVVEGNVIVGTGDGDVFVFRCSAEPAAAEPVFVADFPGAVYAPAIAAGGVLYISTSWMLFAISE
ncbi:MAG: PQQ-binding-like beta-propeller repeat protein [Verrucomicrobiota bacterium]